MTKATVHRIIRSGAMSPGALGALAHKLDDYCWHDGRVFVCTPRFGWRELDLKKYALDQGRIVRRG